MEDEEKPKYGIFIIESMDFDNEQNKKLPGKTLKEILELCDIPNEYFYIRTKEELENIIEKFAESELGFLHIVCHGNEKALGLTFGTIDFEELELILGPHLYHRRLFISACEAANFELAQRFIPKYHCYSLIGSPDCIDYDKAAIFWSSFYYLIYQNNIENMPQSDIIPVLDNLTKSFNLKLNYFSIIRNGLPKSIDHLREINYDCGMHINDRVKKTEFKNQFR